MRAPSSPDPWAWALRLFASVDLVGSTPYKAGKRGEWVPEFSRFFEEFPAHLARCSHRIKRFRDIDLYRFRLRPWKFNGDEILFQVRLESHRDALRHVTALSEALHTFETPMRLKATAWLAGFPVMNRAIMASADDIQITEYLGPSMDVGFRLTRLASPDRMPVSVDLALLLADALPDDGTGFRLYYSGRELLPGVGAGVPYPHIWWAVNHEEQWQKEAVLAGQGRASARRKALIAFCEQFFLDSADPPESRLRRPFIATDIDARYKRVPKWWSDRRKWLRGEDQEQAARELSQSSTPPRGTPPSPRPSDLEDLELPS